MGDRGIEAMDAAITETRLAMLGERIARVAWALARQSGEEHDELVAEITLNILEKAAKNPDLSLQRDAYIVNAGVWPVRDRLRCRAYKVAARSISIEDLVETLAQESEADDDPDGGLGEALTGLPAAGKALADRIGVEMATAILALPNALRQIVLLMLGNPARYMTGTGRLNVTRLSTDLGRGWHSTKNRVQRIALHLKSAEHQGMYRPAQSTKP